MKQAGRIERERATEVRYEQFEAGAGTRAAMAVAGVLTWPVVLPLALLSRLSGFAFLTCAQLLALLPHVFGVITRYEFYRFTLRSCGRNVNVGFGSYFIYRDVEVGDNVLIGAFNTIHHCDFGSYVLTAERCTFLSGPNYHRYQRTDIPMALQGGDLRRIRLGDDCWIGAHCVVMADVGDGSIVGAGAVVVNPVDRYTIVAGVPARPLGRRGSAGSDGASSAADALPAGPL
jgi:acetyltransferase-like isoleucine patch superfamily enzyme